METKHWKGLTDEQAEESRRLHGENILTPPERESVWKLFLSKFNDPIIRILLIAAFLSLGIAFVNGHYAETIGVFCAIFLATGVSFWFEYDAGKKFDILNQVNDDTLIKVVRNGNVHEIPKKEVVVGDIVILETGEEVPADGELLEAISMQVNESTLTGELMVDKTTDPAHFDNEATYHSNLVMRGTTVIDGHGVMVVKTVGDATEFGKVARQATVESGGETPLNKQLDGLAKLIGVLGLILAALIFGILFFKDIIKGSVVYNFSQMWLLGAVMVSVMVAAVKVWLPMIYDGFDLLGKEKPLPKSVANGSWLKWVAFGILIFALLCGAGWFMGIDPTQSASWIGIDEAGRILQYFMVAVTLIVVSVPEGLPMSVTLSLALSMRRMLVSNNLVRKMHACETMGAITVICTDKTGTLTQNQMRVAQTNFYALHDQIIKDDEISTLVKEGISVNSTAYLDYSDESKVKTIGNPTEAALLLWLAGKDINYMDCRENSPVIDRITFSTERKYMATLVKSDLLGKNILYVKGAPEVVLSKCSRVNTEGGEIPMSDFESAVEKQLLQYQNQAMRTLGFAYKVLDGVTELEEKMVSGLVFIGITAISDPVRPDVPDAINECLEAGINIKIVTGDTSATAKEIGRQIGLWNASDTEQNHITGVEFETLDDKAALARVADLKIMSRARPTDKQRLVQLLRAQNEVVAVTGDGTNDAPALNFADVGLSMGSGTSVAKEASDITLLDDSFKSIATAVMWGRSVYQNIQRFVLFQLTINVTAMVIVFIGSIIGRELPLTVTQMLWVNLIMDTFAAAALASLPPNHAVMKDKPRSPDAFIISKPMAANILSVAFSFVLVLMGLLLYFTRTGEALTGYELSMFFTIFVMLQFWNMFNAKAYATGQSAFKNMKSSIGFIIVAGIILVGQVFIVEFGGDVFRTEPLLLKDWLIIIASTSIILWIGELLRAMSRARRKKKGLQEVSQLG